MPATSALQLKRVLSLLILLLVGLAVLSSPRGTGQAASATRQHATKSGLSSSVSSFTCGTWSVVDSPNVGVSDQLSGVAATSASDVWAVGYYYPSPSTAQTLTLHWNGTSWSVVASPNVGSSDNVLSGVAATSASDVWAVGYYLSSTFVRQTLIDHWDGTGWSVVASPNAGSLDNVLSGVAAVSASDVWAVGYYLSSSPQTLIEHWNGKSWSVVASPNVASSPNVLSGVAAVSARDSWAVGNYFKSSSSPYQTLTLHWNGKSWSVVASPNVASSFNKLFGVAAVSARDSWAVGSYETSDSIIHTLTLHWNGKSWSVVASPNVGSSSNELSGVAAVSASNSWAVGYYLPSGSTSLTLIEHWNGTSWSVVASPKHVGSISNVLSGVARVPGSSNIWAVGFYTDALSGLAKTLIEFYC